MKNTEIYSQVINEFNIFLFIQILTPSIHCIYYFSPNKFT